VDGGEAANCAAGTGGRAQRVAKQTLQIKTLIFLRSTDFKLFSQRQGGSTNKCDFVKFITYVRGDHYGYSPRAPKQANALLSLK
jgi:hypothetical protein